MQIDGEVVAGYTSDKASKVIKKAKSDRISLAVRDRPFERTITMQKGSANQVGFTFNQGKIKAVIKDSSAARCVCMCVLTGICVLYGRVCVEEAQWNEKSICFDSVTPGM